MFSKAKLCIARILAGEVSRDVFDSMVRTYVSASYQITILFVFS